MTWNDIAARMPEFVQWVVATCGPLPDGPALEADYDRYVAAYETRFGPDMPNEDELEEALLDAARQAHSDGPDGLGEEFMPTPALDALIEESLDGEVNEP